MRRNGQAAAASWFAEGLIMDAKQLDAARQARIDELCHLMTMCETRDVRVFLCAELKRAIHADQLERERRSL